MCYRGGNEKSPIFDSSRVARTGTLRGSDEEPHERDKRVGIQVISLTIDSAKTFLLSDMLTYMSVLMYSTTIQGI
jgi:hypothetical protein